MKHKWADLIHAWADGAEIEGHDSLWPDDFWRVKEYPLWNSDHWIFRLADPYRKLKEAANDPTKEIRFLKSDGTHSEWDIDDPCQFVFAPDRYEIRDKPAPKPKTRKVKLLGWFNGKHLMHQSYYSGFNTLGIWKRVPGEDKEIEVEESRK